MGHLDGVISGPRPGRMRDRRGRGPRGPLALPGPLSPRGVPAHHTARQRFDALVTDILDALEPHFAIETDDVDVVVEEAPLLPPEWTDPVPLSLVARQYEPVRVIVYRLPVAGRCRSDDELTDLVWEVVLDGLSQVWHVPPDKLDPRR